MAPYFILGQPAAGPPPPPPDPGSLGALAWYRGDSVTMGTGSNIAGFTDKTGNGYNQIKSGGNAGNFAQLVTAGLNGNDTFSAGNPFAGVTVGYDCIPFAVDFPLSGGAITMMAVCFLPADVDANLLYRFYFSSADDTSTSFDGANCFWTPFEITPQLRMHVFENGASDGGGEITVTLGSWVNMYWTCNWGAGTISTYKNGGLVQTNTVSNPGTRTLTGAFFLRNSAGGHNLSNFSSWYGGGADFAIWQEDLTATGKIGLLNDYVEAQWGSALVADAKGRQPEVNAPSLHRKWKRNDRIYVPEQMGVVL